MPIRAADHSGPLVGAHLHRNAQAIDGLHPLADVLARMVFEIPDGFHDQLKHPAQPALAVRRGADKEQQGLAGAMGLICLG